jgi:hypothetical protein
VREVDEDLNALQDDIVGLLPFYIGYEANAAVIMLMLRMIESLRRGKPAEGIGLNFLVPVSHPLEPLKSSESVSSRAIAALAPIFGLAGPDLLTSFGQVHETRDFGN